LNLHKFRYSPPHRLVEINGVVYVVLETGLAVFMEYLSANDQAAMTARATAALARPPPAEPVRVEPATPDAPPPVSEVEFNGTVDVSFAAVRRREYALWYLLGDDGLAGQGFIDQVLALPEWKGVQRTTVSSAVTRLIEQGHIVKCRHPHENRMAKWFKRGPNVLEKPQVRPDLFTVSASPPRGNFSKDAASDRERHLALLSMIPESGVVYQNFSKKVLKHPAWQHGTRHHYKHAEQFLMINGYVENVFRHQRESDPKVTRFLVRTEKPFSA
jgi:hypothetical protein